MGNLDFHCLTLADKDALQAVTLRAGRRNCNYTFANLVGWQFWFKTEVCVLPDAVVLRFGWEGKKAYMVCTKTLTSLLIKSLCDDAGGAFMILGLEDDQIEVCRDMAAHDELQRDQCDYIYRRADLAELKGNKLKAKRNHINHFRTEFPDFEYRDLTPDMFDECRALVSLWRDERGDNNPEYGDTIAAEQRVMETVFEHWNGLDMRGGSIYINGKMVAFTYGAAVTTDTFDVCVEKADRNIDGLFSLINQQFCAHLPEQFVFVNREEDLGIEGLRKSKLSYHPEILLSYNVVHFA